MEALKRGGRMKQKQSVVIKNVINIGKGERRRRRRRVATKKAPQQSARSIGGGLPSYSGVQFPYQKLFQPQSSEPRSLTVSSSNAGELNNNVNALIDKSQQITEGRIKNYINNALAFKAYNDEFNIASRIPNKATIEVMEDDDEEDEEDEEEKKMMKYLQERSKKDKTPIDLTIDEEEEIMRDLGIERKKKEEVVVEDVMEEHKNELLAPVQKAEEAIKAPSSGKKPYKPRQYTEEQDMIRNIQSKKNQAKRRGNIPLYEKYLKEEEDFKSKIKEKLLESQYGITTPPK